MSPRLWALLNQVHNPQLEFMLTLVNTKGQDFLECLQGTEFSVAVIVVYVVIALCTILSFDVGCGLALA